MACAMAVSPLTASMNCSTPTISPPLCREDRRAAGIIVYTNKIIIIVIMIIIIIYSNK